MVVQGQTKRTFFLNAAQTTSLMTKDKRACRILTQCPLLESVRQRTPQYNPISRLQAQSSRDPPKKWPRFPHSSRWFIQQVEACPSLLSLAEAVTCWSRMGSRTHLHTSGAPLHATSDCCCIPRKPWGRRLANAAAGSEMTTWPWLFWQRQIYFSGETA